MAFQAFCEGSTSATVTKIHEMNQSPIPSIDEEYGETVGKENNKKEDPKHNSGQ